MAARPQKVSVRQRRLPAKVWVRQCCTLRRPCVVQDRQSRQRLSAGAVGYVGWEKLTTDKSVVRIVSDAVVGESVTDTIAGTADGVRELTGKAGEAVSSVSGAVTGIDNKLNGVSNFLRQASGGGGLDMFGNFFRNLGSGNVSGLSIAGLVAAAFLIFGRFGWLGKIAGAFLGMMLIGNNAGVFRTPETENVQRTRTPDFSAGEQAHGGGMRR